MYPVLNALVGGSGFREGGDLSVAHFGRVEEKGGKGGGWGVSVVALEVLVGRCLGTTKGCCFGLGLRVAAGAG